MMETYVPAKHSYQIVSHSTVVLRWCPTAPSVQPNAKNFSALLYVTRSSKYLDWAKTRPFQTLPNEPGILRSDICSSVTYIKYAHCKVNQIQDTRRHISKHNDVKLRCSWNF